MTRENVSLHKEQVLRPRLEDLLGVVVAIKSAPWLVQTFFPKTSSTLVSLSG